MVVITPQMLRDIVYNNGGTMPAYKLYNRLGLYDYAGHIKGRTIAEDAMRAGMLTYNPYSMEYKVSDAQFKSCK